METLEVLKGSDSYTGRSVLFLSSLPPPFFEKIKMSSYYPQDQLVYFWSAPQVVVEKS